MPMYLYMYMYTYTTCIINNTMYTCMCKYSVCSTIMTSVLCN